jgi:agmatinase
VKPLDELRLLLRPAGGGLYLVSTGREAQLALQRRLYDASTDAEVEKRWLAALEAVATAEAFVLGIPSDVGAGFRRGANLAPLEVRSTLMTQLPDWPERLAARGVVDVGDVFVVPQLLHDDMVSDAQKEATRKALYPDVAAADRAALPVAPLSIAERALDLLFGLNPNAKPFVIGGDHSTAWPVASALSRARKDRWAIVQPDAHTDLLAERLGVKYCFATWSYHANELFGRDGRLVQVGTRASRHDRAHWESTLGVRQLWAEECRRDPAAAIDAICKHLASVRATGVYFSNDIDGTDEAWADATGTPEPGGLEPEMVIELIRRLGKEVGLIGGDIMEVAPAVQDRADSKTRTLGLAGRYVRETLGAMLGAPL